MADMREVFEAWRPAVARIDCWRNLVSGSPESIEGFGNVHQLPNLAKRPDESIVVAEMGSGFLEPCHFLGSKAIYFALEGWAHVGVGHSEQRMGRGNALLVPARTAHFMAVDRFVAAIVTSPTLSLEEIAPIDPHAPVGGFDRPLYKHIAHGQPLGLPA